MIKKLNGFEALNAPIGTQFEVKYKRGTTRKVQVYGAEDSTFLKYIDINEFAVMDFHKGIDTATFIPIQQPVSFMKVVNSDKKCRVEHELTKPYRLYKEFNGFSKVMEILSTDFIPRDLKKIIREGKWYIEESEADSNDIR